ncbi:MAG: hypothetical protein GY765_18195 [bacterium]|nr:hypothetical protein [bacterium]
MATNRHFILTNSLEIKEAGAFRDDLNRQCGLIMLPASLVAIFTWLPYIELDMHLCPDFPSFIYLRLGMSLMGMIILLFHRLSLRRPDNYLLLFLLMTYVDLSSAFIVGLSSAAPAYIGGLCIIILIHPMLPFLRGTTLFLMGFSIIVFLSVGSYSRMSFDTELQNYGLYNLLSAVLVSIIGVTILDRIRRIKFKKKILLQDAHEKLCDSLANHVYSLW